MKGKRSKFFDYNNKDWFLKAIDKIFNRIDREMIRRDIRQLRSKHPELNNEELARKIVRRSLVRTTAMGAGSGLPSFIPGIGGIIGAIAGVSVGLIYMIAQQMLLQLRIAEVYGLDLDSKERVAENLIFMFEGYGLGSFSSFMKEHREEIKNIGTEIIDSRKITPSTIKNVLKAMGLEEITSYVYPKIIKFLSSRVSPLSSPIKGAPGTSLRRFTRTLPVIGMIGSAALTFSAVRSFGRYGIEYYSNMSGDGQEPLKLLKKPTIVE